MQDRQIKRNLFCLPDSVGAVGCLGLHCGVPPAPVMHDVVRLHYREPDTRHERRQYEDIESRLDAEVMQNGISGLDARRLKRSAPHFRFAVDDADRELKLLLKDLCEDSLHGDRKSTRLNSSHLVISYA